METEKLEMVTEGLKISQFAGRAIYMLDRMRSNPGILKQWRKINPSVTILRH